MPQQNITVQPAKNSRHLIIIICLILAAAFLPSIPFINILLSPINTFVTFVHESGHALACLLTGGDVSGLTIVSDNQGHGGLTFCHGGMPFIYAQAGYLGSALFGCLLIMLGKFPKLSKFLLVFIGLSVSSASLFLMPGTIFQEGRIWEGLGSIAWGIILGAGFIYAGIKLKANTANLVLLFIATQTALNSISGIIYLARNSFAEGITSDASSMAKLTGIPVFVWASFWVVVSVSLFAATLWWTYISSQSPKIPKKS